MDKYSGVSQASFAGGKDSDRPFVSTLGGVHDPGGSGYNHGNRGPAAMPGAPSEVPFMSGTRIWYSILFRASLSEMMLGARQPVERGVAGRVESPGLSGSAGVVVMAFRYC